MKHLTIIILVMLTASKAIAQDPDSASAQRSFRTQGEWEDYRAEKLFEESYAKKEFARFIGDVAVVDKNNICFGNKILRAYFPEELKSIFTLGIFYPQLITGDSVSSKKTEEEVLRMTVGGRIFYKMTQNDTLTIGAFEELKFLNPCPTVKRFRFWEYQNWCANPQVYFMELTNTTADQATDMATFIKGATLTFIKAGWIII